MKITVESGHGRLVAVCCASIAVLVVSSGCNSGSPTVSKTEEAQMRAAFAKKGPVNMNDLPPDQKAKIQEFFQKGGGAPSAPSAQPPPAQGGQ